ncbi:MAG: flagellar biosynthetic protein FliR [Limnohabitans sp.]|jgi:flagellar biosynthetic protein FliR|uniref:flagellar biosynthetic protein FliR n=1 Tax=Limnohabitans sp. TaxID=1907725 RepID=UPI0025D4E6D6|nr:flagellar biosynthetic protein FliR [Limnohabitans sp.]MCO4088207.1 flagellar biosynthetic protein FliR [Limnohabitans sp.]
MNLLAADIVERFYLFLWPMLRISALMITAPIFSLKAFNLRLRILMALVLAWLVYPLHRWPLLDPTTAPGLIEVFNQIMIGSVMGLILQVVVAAFVVGGQSIAAAMGLSMANMLDPNMGNVPVISQLMIIMSTLIFVGFGGHAIMLGLISESFNTLPIGTSMLNQNVYGQVLKWSSMMFLGAVLLALPIMVSLLFINIGLGVVTRAAPSLNIFAVGFPAMIIAGFLILIISMGSIGARMEWLWVQGFNVVRDVMGVPNV